jgi:hypothetical protein
MLLVEGAWRLHHGLYSYLGEDLKDMLLLYMCPL